MQGQQQNARHLADAAQVELFTFLLATDVYDYEFIRTIESRLRELCPGHIQQSIKAMEGIILSYVKVNRMEDAARVLTELQESGVVCSAHVIDAIVQATLPLLDDPHFQCNLPLGSPLDQPVHTSQAASSHTDAGIGKYPSFPSYTSDESSSGEHTPPMLESDYSPASSLFSLMQHSVMNTAQPTHTSKQKERSAFRRNSPVTASDETLSNATADSSIARGVRGKKNIAFSYHHKIREVLEYTGKDTAAAPVQWQNAVELLNQMEKRRVVPLESTFCIMLKCVPNLTATMDILKIMRNVNVFNARLAFTASKSLERLDERDAAAKLYSAGIELQQSQHPGIGSIAAASSASATS